MIYEIIPVDFTVSHDQVARLLYDFVDLSGSQKFQNFFEFIRFKKEESALELRWDYVLKKRDFPIGVLTINNTYQEPDPIFFLNIKIDKENLHFETKALIKNWLKQEQVIHGFGKIISNLNSLNLERYLLELGGKVVNWLYFYELNIGEIDVSISKIWNNEKLLKSIY